MVVQAVDLKINAFFVIIFCFLCCNDLTNGILYIKLVVKILFKFKENGYSYG